MYKELKVPVEWKCHKLDKICVATVDGVFHSRWGWMCDCGEWIHNQSSNEHTIIRRDIRSVYFE